MEDRYFITEDGVEREVTFKEFIKYERKAGFYPKLASDHPRFMECNATGGFSGNGYSGRIEYAPVEDE